MKNLSKKSVSLVLILTILMAIFMPTMVSANDVGRIGGKRVTFTETDTSSEQVANSTDMEQYINSKKNALIESLTSENIPVDLDHSNIDPNTLFSTTSPYKYATISNISVSYAMEETLIQVYTVNYTLVNVTKSSTSTEITGTTKYPSKNGDVINSYNITSDVVTLYVGNISVDGTSTLKYLYTDKSVNTETLTEMRKILTSDYASLLPTTAGQVAVSNDSSVTVNDVFTDAGMVAINKYPSGIVSDTSSTILYNQTQYNSLATASQAEISDEATAETNNLSAWNTRKNQWDTEEQNKVNADPEYTPVSFPEEYRNAFEDTTTYPTSSFFIADNKGESSIGYIIRNGGVAQVNTYPLNRTIIKVVNTSADVTMPAYEYIDDTANQTYTINQDETLTFRINADYSLFENGGKVYVDDTLVSSDNYTSKSGSTIITFTKDYMSSLSEGEHTLKVAFNNGGSATTKFTVAKADTTTDTETTAEEKTTTTTSNNPKTGDNIVIWISLMIVSILGVAGTVKFVKKNK